jgi:hypothetical protein
MSRTGVCGVAGTTCGGAASVRANEVSPGPYSCKHREHSGPARLAAQAACRASLRQARLLPGPENPRDPSYAAEEFAVAEVEATDRERDSGQVGAKVLEASAMVRAGSEASGESAC